MKSQMKTFVVTINTNDGIDQHVFKGIDLKNALRSAFDLKEDTDFLGCDKMEEFNNDFNLAMDWIDNNNNANGFSREFGITILGIE